MNKASRFLNVAQQATRQSMPFVNAKDDDTTEIFIYDVIGGFFSEPTGELVKAISKIETAEIVVRINSPGGQVFDGIAIYNALNHHPARIVAQVDGIAGSIASVIAMAGEEIHMLRGTHMMIHKPMMFAGGNSDDLRDMAELLDKVEDSMIDIYQTKTSMTAKEIKAALEAETWYTPEEALEVGLATHIDEAPAAENRFNLCAIFDNVPDGLRPEPTVRDVEQTLRDSGVSRSKSERMAVAAIAALSQQGEPAGEDQGDPELLASFDKLIETFRT